MPLGTIRIENLVTVSAASVDDDLANNSFVERTFVQERSDLSVTKVLDTAGPYTAGTPVTFTVTVTNNGPSTATNVSVSVLLKESVTNKLLKVWVVVRGCVRDNNVVRRLLNEFLNEWLWLWRRGRNPAGRWTGTKTKAHLLVALLKVTPRRQLLRPN